MSIEDEVKAERERRLKQHAEEEKKAAFGKELAYNGFYLGYDTYLIYPNQDFAEVINEALPSLIFDKPKVVKVLSDENAYIRFPKDDEKANTYSFDVPYQNGFISIFSNGTFASYNCTLNSSNLRYEIIQILAVQSLNSSKAENPKIDIMWENSAEGLSFLKKMKENKQAEEKRRAAEIEEIRLKEQEKLEAFEHRKREKILAERNRNIRKNLLWAAFWFLTLSPILWEYLFYFTESE